jgi:adenylate cyclase
MCRRIAVSSSEWGSTSVRDGRDIYGDGVNVAARLEALAEPGGICVSRVVRDQVRDKLAFAFEDMGEQQVKNITRPVRVHRIRLFEEEGFSIARPSYLATPALALPDKPSVAVLPFTNMSGDPEQEFVSDGIAEDVITALSRYPSLFVIARNSCFTYKGRAVDVKQVGRDLGVRYVLEGGVRKAGNRYGLPHSWSRPRAVSTSGPSVTTAISPTFLRCRTRSQKQ